MAHLTPVEKRLGEQMADLLARFPHNYDVTFSVGTDKVKVNAVKIILKAVSPVFQEEFDSTRPFFYLMKDGDAISLPDVDPTIFKLFVKLITADTWSVDDLNAMNMSPNTKLSLLGLCRRFEITKGISNLELVAGEFLENPDDILSSFDRFMQDFDEMDQESSPSPPEIVVLQDNSDSDDDDIDDDIVELGGPPSPGAAQHDHINDVGHQMIIRIQFNGQEYKFLGNAGWDMERVRRQLSRLTEVPQNELLIYAADSQKMVDGKPLCYYNIDAIQGWGVLLEAVRRPLEIPRCSPAKSRIGEIRLKFQTAGLRTPIIMDVSKFMSLKEIRSILALELESGVEDGLYFHFDGENVDLASTPEDLHLEDNDCIDVFLKSN